MADRPSGAPRAHVLTAYAAAATVLISLVTWAGFTETPAGFLVPLFFLALTVATTGVLARSARIPALLVFPVQVLVAAVVACLLLTGEPLPLGSTYTDLVGQWQAAMESAQVYAAPVPPDAAPIDPLLIGSGLAFLLLVDLVAITLRRPPAAGLLLLVVYSVPVSLLGVPPAWWLFALTAGGFLLLLYIDESERIVQWGRPIGRSSDRLRVAGLRGTAAGLGVAATALAVVVPLGLPTFDASVGAFGRGVGGDGELELTNPMVDLRRDLLRGPDVPLVRVSTNDPDPEYLRIAVLTNFTGEEWRPGERQIPRTNVALGTLPPPSGLDDSTPRESYAYAAEAYDEFRSSWLPTQFPITSIHAEGDWRYDESTMDFTAVGDGLNAASRRWRMTAIEPQFTAEGLAVAPARAGAVADIFTDLPDDLAPLVDDLTEEVTGGVTSRLERAVALQDWFRTGGGFVYDTSVDLGNGGDDLAEFLTDRRGYCEQFAAAMAVMARHLDIPARVAVGFLRPSPTSNGDYVYSAHDLHAWPELYFAGHGWVRFEPTPSTRAPDVPTYTEGLETGPDPTSEPLPTQSADASGGVTQAPRGAEAGEASEDPTAEADRFPWAGVLLGVLLAAGLVVLLLLPRSVRSRRRSRRLAGGPEDVWAELRDLVVDLGLDWPHRRTPRQTRSGLIVLTGGNVALELDRIVRAVEQYRYSPRPMADEGALREAAEAVSSALKAEAGKAGRRRATWWPASVFRRGPEVSHEIDERAEESLLSSPTS